MSFGKGTILKIVVSQGTAAIKRKLKDGEIKSTDLVDVEDELRTAKGSIGASADIVGITDDDLRRCIRKIAQNCKLGLKE